MIKRFILLAIIFSISGIVSSANLKPYTGKGKIPDLKLYDLQGKQHSLDDYKGHVVLVQFWATYCTPCRKEMPSMNKLMKKMAGVPFKILAVDMGEEKEEVERFVNEVKPEFTILMDSSGKSISDWRVFAAPSNFIIDSEGNIKYTLFGGVEWDSDEMVQRLKALSK